MEEMKKRMKHVILMLSLVVLFSSPVTAVESTNKAQGRPTNMPVAAPDMVTAQEQETIQEEEGERSQTARENMSVVAQKVEEFLAC
jgi:TolA-binding protein